MNSLKIENLDSKELRALYSIRDFQLSLSALTFLLEECDFTKKYSKEDLRRFKFYEEAMINGFSRPFEQTRSNTTIGLKRMGVILSEEEKRDKERLLEARRKIVAHSDEEFMSHQLGLVVIDDNGLLFPFFRWHEGLVFKHDELVRFEGLIKKLIFGTGKYMFLVLQEAGNK